ncbi:MAG TPA: ankyrin repeat domain-containing protein [Thermoleophilaceae bacterium]|jgi:ankyrin repeat protein
MAGEQAVFEALEAGDADRLRELLGDRPELASARSEDGVSALLKARYAMRDDLVEAVLAAEPELDVYDAAAVGDVDRLKELIDGDPQLTRAFAADGFTALHLASFFGAAEAVRILLDRGADPGAQAANDMRVAPLHSAAAAGDRDAVGRLLEAGADPNARQRGGYTALHAAAGAGDRELAELLLSKGAKPDERTDDGSSPRDVAAAKGHEELAELLAESSA